MKVELSVLEVRKLKNTTDICSNTINNASLSQQYDTLLNICSEKDGNYYRNNSVGRSRGHRGVKRVSHDILDGRDNKKISGDSVDEF